ncbi:MAG: L-carnitine dehydratase/bile acid-inducible protein [Frankiales bacterium]|nr:L-carnitine dehydratase/bile acid-inducible protein [Frankiales bacterium]
MSALADALAAGPGWPVRQAFPGPLSGTKVLDLSRVLAGPYCCMVLADLGADVLKLERPGLGDDTRRWGPPFHGEDATYFFGVNRDRRSLAIDLTTSAGREVVAHLVGNADVVVENFLPKHLRALGLEQLREEASCVWVSVRGAGGDGPDGEKPGYDVMAQARSGLMSVTGTTEPTKMGVAIADVVTGLYAAVGAVAGLAARRPVKVEVGLLESAIAAIVNQGSSAFIGGVVPGPIGNSHPNLAPYGPFRCADTSLVIGAGNDAQFRALCRVLDVEPDPGWASNAGRVTDRTAMVTALERALSRRTAGEWAQLLTEAGVPSGAVQDLGMLPSDPQVVATGQLQTLPHPAGPVTVVGSPYRFDGVRPRVHDAPPLLGQHSVEVLTALGLDSSLVEEVLGADGR